jgi:hypothetical protein
MKQSMAKEYANLREARIEALEARMRDRTASQQKALVDRAEMEVADITTVVTELARTIEAELEDPDYQAMGDREYRQLTLFSDTGSDQGEWNHDALRASPQTIPEEIERETAIRARYDSPRPRVFPVAVSLPLPERIYKG